LLSEDITAYNYTVSLSLFSVNDAQYVHTYVDTKNYVKLFDTNSQDYMAKKNSKKEMIDFL